MALNALYRITSGEILILSDAAITPPDAYTANYAPASTPDGTDLSTPKIKDGTAMRNATGGEISGFGAYTTADAILAAKAIQKTWFDDENAVNEFRFRGLMLWMIDKFNAIHADADIGLDAITESEAISDIKAKMDAD